METSAEYLDRLTAPGTLYERLEDGAVRCYACAHRCLIKPGRRGICKVRFNQDGELRVPFGYVAALQSDPVEKKPFFHLFPGVDALTFGMLGCDFHCGFCFPGDTMVLTNRGPVSFADAFDHSVQIRQEPDGEIGVPEGLLALTSAGMLRPVRAVFRHPYHGPMVRVKPYYLPEFRCTADHRVYATTDPAVAPAPVQAQLLTRDHYLAVPRGLEPGTAQTVHAERVLRSCQVTHKVRWDLSPELREEIALASAAGETSRSIGARLGKSGSYIRHVRSKIARRVAADTRTAGPLVEAGWLRFPNEHRPGIPNEIPVTEELARLLGLYCAEGGVVRSRQRPNSLVLNFSFSRGEKHLVAETRALLEKIFCVQARVIERDTTLSVSVSKASLALLFEALAGKGAIEKKVPEPILASPQPVIRAFLDGYVTGDGHRYKNGKVNATTVSRVLAYGLAWLALKLGQFPSVYETQFHEPGVVLGRLVNRSPAQYSIVWYEEHIPRRKLIETEQYYLVPLRAIDREEFSGSVYNMEVAEEHNYLANLSLVSNCQNWVTSQMLRDPAAEMAASLVRRVTPLGLAEMARRAGAGVAVSSYNEPLITSEWAAAVFTEMQKIGLPCAYVSNGNMTPEVLEYIRPYLTAYKVDLKSMRDKHYRELGGVLQNVLDGIALAVKMGLWVEVVTLVIPGFNDSSEELWDAARFLTSVSRDIPWHVTAFHPDYKMTDPEPTSMKTLRQAAEIGQEAGLNYVYAGNLPGQDRELEHTHCPGCRTRLIERVGYRLVSYAITAQGTCPKCGTRIPGVWTDRPETVRLGGPGYPRRV